jgi:transcriptional regulator with XRE-family HTH domain
MNFLQFLRLRRGLSQKQLAKKLRVPQSCLCKWELQYSPLPGYALIKLQRLFGSGWTTEKLFAQVPEVTPDMVKPAA